MDKHTIISEHADFDERNTISSPTPTLPSIQAHAPCYIAPDIEDTSEDNALEAPMVLHPGGAPDPIGEQDSEPNTPIAAPQPLPDAPETPPPAPEPVQSPIGIGVHLPRRICQRPQEWWKLSPAQLVNNDSDDSDDEEADIAHCFTSNTAHPRSFKEAMKRADAAEWRQAAVDELAAHQTNRTWTLINRPKDRPVIGSK